MSWPEWYEKAAEMVKSVYESLSSSQKKALNYHILKLAARYILLLLVLGGSMLEAEISEARSYVLVKEELPLIICSEIEVSFSSKSEEHSSWRHINNSTDSLDVLRYYREGPFKLRFTLENRGADTAKVSFKTISTYSSVQLRFNESVFELSNSRYDRYISDTYYPAVHLSLPPGVSEFILHCAPAVDYKAYLWQIVIDHPEGVFDDKFSVYENQEGFIYFLVAFVGLVAFQVFYMIIQYYYHRRREYVEYILYLSGIFLYFSIRLEQVVHIDILTGNIREARPYLNDIMMFIPYLFYLRFARAFIGLRTKYPRMDRRVRYFEYFIGLIVLVIAVFAFTGRSVFSPQVMLSIGIVLFVYSVYLITYFFKQRDRLIDFLLLGSLCAATGYFLANVFTVIMNLTGISMIPPLILSMTGISFEIFFFNTGLGYKAKFEQEEKLEAQTELILQLKRNERINNKLQGIRDSIASDLHDDLGSTLGSIGLYSELAEQKVDGSPAEAKGIIRKITENSRKMLEAMNDIIWSMHSKRNGDQDLYQRMRSFTSERVIPAGIEMKYLIDESAGDIVFSMDAKRNILLFFKEAINNAVKYSGSKLITCRITVRDDRFEMEVADLGRGFIHGTVTGEGNGMRTMQERIENLNGSLTIDSDPGKGTSIKASVAVHQITAA